jgi:ubiquinone/menaquinone biosynthesis C-methylase UbiE
MKRLSKENINTKKHWNKVIEKTGVGAHSSQIIRYQTISRHIRSTPCDVVDFGCGAGSCDIWIRGARPLARLTGVDFVGIGKEAVLESDDGKKKYNLFNKFVEGDVTKSGLPSESYDYAISAEVLEHLDAPQKLIDEMYRVLRPTGRLILTTPLLNRLPSGEHVWEFTLDDVEDMLWSAGFKRVWVIPMASGGEVLEEDSKMVINPE